MLLQLIKGTGGHFLKLCLQLVCVFFLLKSVIRLMLAMVQLALQTFFLDLDLFL